MQILEKDGQPAFAILPFEEYQALLDAQEELNDIRDSQRIKEAIASGEEETIPSAVVDALLDGGNPIKIWRTYRNLKQTELAAQAGITPAYLSQIENGTRTGSIDVLRRLATVLKLDLDDLD